MNKKEQTRRILHGIFGEKSDKDVSDRIIETMDETDGIVNRLTDDLFVFTGQENAISGSGHAIFGSRLAVTESWSAATESRVAFSETRPGFSETRPGIEKFLSAIGQIFSAFRESGSGIGQTCRAFMESGSGIGKICSAFRESGSAIDASRFDVSQEGHDKLHVPFTTICAGIEKIGNLPPHRHVRGKQQDIHPAVRGDHLRITNSRHQQDGSGLFPGV